MFLAGVVGLCWVVGGALAGFAAMTIFGAVIVWAGVSDL